MNESESIVTCKDIDNPNFQIQGALSDLNCKNSNTPKTRKMELDFKNWFHKQKKSSR